MQSESTEYNPDSFYPFREQEKSGDAVVPILDPGHELPPPAHRASWPIIIPVGIIVMISAFVIGYNSLARQRIAAIPTPTVIPTWTPIPTPTPIPAQKITVFTIPELQTAYNQTIAAQTLKAAFISQVHTINTKNSGEQSSVDSQVEGYLFGASDGSTIQTELKITYSAAPDRSAFFGQILVDNRLFMKVNDQDWIERNKSDYNKLYENQPIDATAYSYNMLDTLFTKSKALLRGIDSASVKQEPDEQIDNKTLHVYSFILANKDYLDALERDTKTTSFTMADARKIIGTATIGGKLYVDPTANYIVRINLTGVNLTQISTDQSQLLGQTTVHSMNMTANLVDFNTPLSLKAPTQ